MTVRVVSIQLVLAIPLGARAQVKPHIMIDVDTSGSMLCDACQSGTDLVDDSAECPGTDISCGTCAVLGCSNGTPDDSRLTKVKLALADVVNSFGEITFGLARFAQTPNVFACNNTCGSVNPSGGWTGATSQFCDGAAPGQVPNAADILVPFTDDNQTELLYWVDGCDNWPTVDDCDPIPPEDLGGDTCAVGELCPDCGTGCDKELRGSGFTALAGSLASVREHIENVARLADPAAGCRPYGVILLADGADNCDGEAELEAEQLCDVGVPTYSIGFGSCPLGCDDPCFDDCPGSTCPTRGITPEGCFGANDLPHACVGNGDIFPDPGECTVGCQLFCQTKEIAQFGCGPNCNATAQGQQRCEGQPIVVEDETQLALAMAEIAMGAVLRELCNGLDDDCDGLIDEEFPGLGEDCCDPCPGTVVCNVTQDGTMCSGIGPPGVNCPEVCNGLDDDCDKLIDEGLLCPVEVCDGMDNDGDSETDEPPLPDIGHPCGTNEGECIVGNTCCLDGLLQCCGDTSPQPEMCDCLDNNCNTQTDEGASFRCYGGDPSECPFPLSGVCHGFCRPGARGCVTTGCPTTWEYGPCVNWLGPRVEECNCVDDDCDDLTDEDVICGNGAPCVDCQCLAPCDPCDEFPCPLGSVCNGECQEPGEPPGGPFHCVPDLCLGKTCDVGEKCEPITGVCVSLCEGVDCGSLTCCGGDCCQTWQTCQDLDGDRLPTCDDTTCTNPAFACKDGAVCIDHACVGDPCVGVECGDLAFCLDGECRPVCPDCGDEERCVEGRCVPDLCAHTECLGTHAICCEGSCINDPCAAAPRCGSGEYCDGCAGTCREDLCPRVHCPEGYECVRGECEPPGNRENRVTDLAASGSGGCACDLGAQGRPAPWGLVGLLLAAAMLRARRAPRGLLAGKVRMVLRRKARLVRGTSSPGPGTEKPRQRWWIR